MKSTFTFILIVLLIQINIAQNSFVKIIGDNDTPTLSYNFITNGNSIILAGHKTRYNSTDTIKSSYLCKLSEFGEIVLETEDVLQDIAIIHRDIVKTNNNNFWTFSFLYDKKNYDNIYSYKLSEYDYDFNLIKEFNINLPDTLHYHWWLSRQHTRLRYYNNKLILSDILRSEKPNDDGLYNYYTFYYNLNTNGDSLNFKMIKNYGVRKDFKIYDNETIFSTKWESGGYPNGVIIKKTNIEDFNTFETFYFNNHFTLSNEKAYLKFISDTSFIFSGTQANPPEYAYISILDTSFNLIKSKLYGSGKFQLFSARNNGLAVANDGSIYTVFSRGIATEYVITKLSSDLNVIWERFFISGGDFLYSIKATNDGGCAILGNTIINNKYHALILKLDAQGTMPTSIENPKIKFRELIIYPNPSTTNLNIRTAVQCIGGEFIMYDITGKQIITQKITQAITTINTNNLPKGTYIYKYIYKAKEIESGKWIKQ